MSKLTNIKQLRLKSFQGINSIDSALPALSLAGTLSRPKKDPILALTQRGEKRQTIKANRKHKKTGMKHHAVLVNTGDEVVVAV